MAPKRGRPRRHPSPPPPGPPLEMLDFRCKQDDAWYGAIVRLEEEGRLLRVMYTEFSAEFDEKYDAGEFESEGELVEFGKRFRRASVQLQDAECWKAAPGMMVLVAHAFGPNETKFYDAVIESVNSGVHPLEKGKCSCTFVVHWKHGPLVGDRTTTAIENICLLQPKNLASDPTVTKFMDTARKSLVEKSINAGYFQKRSGQNLECDNAKFSDMGSYGKASDMMHTTKEQRIQHMSDDDIDLGSDSSENRNHSKKTVYFFRIENIDIDVSALDITDFILEKASLTSHAFICPNTVGEFYSRATVLVETDEAANKLYKFLHDSSHIITSLRGRPWLTDENWRGSVDNKMHMYEIPSSTGRKGKPSKIKLVHEGTQEYELAKQRQALHAEFHNHIQRNLLPRLMEDEREIICKQPRKGSTEQQQLM